MCVFYAFALLSIISDYTLKIFHASEALVMDDRAEKAYKPSLGRRPLPLPLVEYRTLELLPEKNILIENQCKVRVGEHQSQSS